jgi:hypothetical protein
MIDLEVKFDISMVDAHGREDSTESTFLNSDANRRLLGLTVWLGKSDPTAEVLTDQVRRPSTQGWKCPTGRVQNC